MEKYTNEPFQVLGFPCSQFLNQEPGANASEIFATLKHIRPGDGFVPNFQMFAKTKVNGEGENSIYTFLKSRCDSPQERIDDTWKLLYKPLHSMDIRWNFEKFLIDQHGNPIKRYHESIDPLELTNDIEVMLARLPRKNGGDENEIQIEEEDLSVQE